MPKPRFPQPEAGGVFIGTVIYNGVTNDVWMMELAYKTKFYLRPKGPGETFFDLAVLERFSNLRWVREVLNLRKEYKIPDPSVSPNAI